MAAKKHVSHRRHGQGKISSHRLTPFRAGPRVGETFATARMADTFVDVYPYVSLKGVDTERTYDRRGDTMNATDESHIQHRTRGHKHRAIVAKGQFRDG